MTRSSTYRRLTGPITDVRRALAAAGLSDLLASAGERWGPAERLHALARERAFGGPKIHLSINREAAPVVQVQVPFR